MKEKEIILSDGTVVKMREPKVRDVRAVINVKSNDEKELKMIANITGLSEDELDEMSIKDYKKLQDEGLKSFL